MRSKRNTVERQINKRKIINDPVYGFISIPDDFIFDLIEHPWFQRLRNIRQLGLAYFVYPGGNHSRFQHSLGALHLTTLAIQTLREKGIEITPEEEEGTYIAILLHDTGHCPFSHALESTIIPNIKHEMMSLTLMKLLNEQFDNRLRMAIDIFTGDYPRKFLHELISGQIDMDRLDYLRRDSFFTGVIEGSVGSDRIIRMLNVVDDKLVVEEKGIYSIEKLLVARRLMYWQVYMHKTVLAAESILVKMMRRARELTVSNKSIFLTPAMEFFFKNNINDEDIQNKGDISAKTIVEQFTSLDDSDILVSAKYWKNSDDRILADLASRIINRNLFAIELQDTPFTEDRIEREKASAKRRYSLNDDEVNYYVYTNTVHHRVYSPNAPDVRILLKSGGTDNISNVSDMFNLDNLLTQRCKYYICYPKN